MKISVIIPIYNVSRFIAHCVESLMKQTLDEIEYIFVNDATPDNSMDILHSVLACFPQKTSQIKIIEHKFNKGLPSARNTGLSVAMGEYIYHCDSDDYLDERMLEDLYNVAKEKDADFVWCDWFLSYENNERYMKQPSFDNPIETLMGMLDGSMKYNVWNKLVKRSLYVDNDIEFPNGHAMGEDMTMIRLAACAEKVAYVSKALYHYVRSNSEAMTQVYSERHLADVCHNVDETLEFLAIKGLDAEREIAFFKLNVKLPLLITGNWKAYRRWNELYPETNKYIIVNDKISWRTRFLQWMAAKKIYLYVWVYYQLIYRCLYTIIFKKLW